MEPSMTLSSDGRRLLYARASMHRNLWLIEPGRSRGPSSARPLTTGAVVESQPRFSPDGREIAFVRIEGTASEIYVTSANGGAPRRLTHLNVRTGDPAWSPDGRELAFSSNLTGRYQLHRVERDGGRVRAWTATHASEHWQGLAWAPSDSILYAAPGNRNYVVMDPVSGVERRLLRRDSPGLLAYPRLSPDGSRVATLFNAWPSTAVWIISRDGSWLRATEGTPMMPIGWCPDGSCLLLLDPNHDPPRIMRHEWKSGSTDEYLQFAAGDLVVEAAFSPQGDRLIYVVERNESNVWLMDGLPR
jgi:Tol biopolymer transport system component